MTTQLDLEFSRRYRRHVRHRMHANSGAARPEIETLSDRETLIVDHLRHHGRSTDRQICVALDFADMNAIRPRVSELLDRGILVEDGSTIDGVTRKTVRLVRIANR